MRDIGALNFLLLTVSGSVNRRQLAAIEYLREENRVLRELLGKRLRLTDSQRRRLAEKGWPLGRSTLKELGAIVTPDTIVRWYRQLIATKLRIPTDPIAQSDATRSVNLEDSIT